MLISHIFMYESRFFNIKSRKYIAESISCYHSSAVYIDIGYMIEVNVIKYSSVRCWFSFRPVSSESVNPAYARLAE